MVSQKEKRTKEWRSLHIEVPLVEGVTATYENGVLTTTGPKGSVSKRLKYPQVTVEVKEGNIVIGTQKLSQKQKKIIFTYRAHATNLVKGVSEGFTYKLSVVYAKFPMTVESNGTEFKVKNLLGEKLPRTVKLPEDVEVKVEGNKDITVTGIDKEKTGQVAAALEQLTRITHLDRRVIQDGIYIVEKPHKRYV